MAITDILTLTPDFNAEESIEFVTEIDESETGYESRDSVIDNGLREYRITSSYLTDDQMNTIWDFYKARQGATDDFLIKIIHEFKTTDEILGEGDGETRQFTLHNFPVDTSSNNSAKLDGVAEAGYVLTNDTANEESYITFNSAPANEAVITVSYEYYLRVRFKEDNLTRELINYKLLNTSLDFIEVRWNTYNPINGNSSSSSSSSSFNAANIDTWWFGIVGENDSTTTLNWDGYSYTVIKPSQRANVASIVNKCIIKKFVIYLSVPPGVGKRRTFTLYHNDIATPLEVSISDTENSGEISSDVICEDGDVLYMRMDKINTPASSQISISYVVNSGSSKKQILPTSHCDTLSIIVWRWWSIWGPESSAFITGNRDNIGERLKAIITSKGSFREILLRGLRPLGIGRDTSRTNTVYLTKKVGESFVGEQTSLSASIQNLSTLDIDEDNSVSVSPGDLVIYETNRIGVNSFLPPVGFSIQFIPDEDNNFIYGHTTLSAYNPSATDNDIYGPMHGNDIFEKLSSRPSPYTIFPMSGTIKNFSVFVTYSPVAGFPITYTIYKNDIATDIIVTLTNISRTGKSNNTLNVQPGDKLYIRVNGATAPTGGESKLVTFGWTFVPDTPGEFPFFSNFYEL